MKKITASLALVAGLWTAFDVTDAHSQGVSPMVYGVQVENLELRYGDERENIGAWGADAFVGNDEFRLRWLSEGEYDFDNNKFEGLENRFMGQVPISDFFDAKAGVRFDTPNGRNKERVYAAVGVTGLAPQWFEVDADLFYSEKGNLSARLDAEYELLLTNHWILTPSLDLSYAFSDDTQIEELAGFTKLETGVRLSYDLVDRLVSPYVGIVHERKLGDTADYVKAEGEDYETWFFVLGVKMVF